MKLRNKITGEIRNAVDIDMYTDSVYLKVSDGEFDNETIEYHSLTELNANWEDAPEEPKEYWYISCDGRALKATADEDDYNEKHISGHKSIGNYFSSKEDAKKAVEKLKAWKRLKDKGFKFCCDIEYESLCGNGFNIPLNAIMPPEAYADTEVSEDLDLLLEAGK